MPRNTVRSTENINHSMKEQDPVPKSSPDENVKAAYEQAEEDIRQDAELSIHSPNDDLDEGESARLGEDRNDLA